MMKILNSDNYRFILASHSPRRQLLLREMGLKFNVLARQVDEHYPVDLIREQIPLYISQSKSLAYGDLLNDEKTIIITADTIVWLDNKVLGKPDSRDEAFSTLHTLSGCMHEVFTGVCIRAQNKHISFYECTRVYFKQLTDYEINYYLNRFRPLDKAGAYGIQEWIGYIGIEKIDGCYYNVMGLPVSRLYRELTQFCQPV